MPVCRRSENSLSEDESRRRMPCRIAVYCDATWELDVGLGNFSLATLCYLTRIGVVVAEAVASARGICSAASLIRDIAKKRAIEQCDSSAPI